MKSFSVLIPVYHGDKIELFKNAVESILSNSLKPSEVVIVRDGPVHYEIEQYLLEIEKKYNYFVILRLDKNNGIVSALNNGLRMCQHEYIIRADADDVNCTDRFYSIMNRLEMGYDLVGSQIIEVSNGIIEGKRKVPTNESDIKNFIKYRNPFNHMSVGFRKAKVLEVGGYPDVFKKEDYALWIKMIANNAKVINLSDVLVKVNGGPAMHARRGGLKYLRSEIIIAKLLFIHKIQSPIQGALVLMARIFALSSPTKFKSYIYSLFLRSKN